MKQEYIDSMNKFVNDTINIIISKDAQYNEGDVDVLQYMPKRWESCATYLLECTHRLDSMIISGQPPELWRDKMTDLLAYVLFTHLKLEDLQSKKIPLSVCHEYKKDNDDTNP